MSTLHNTKNNNFLPLEGCDSTFSPHFPFLCIYFKRKIKDMIVKYLFLSSFLKRILATFRWEWLRTRTGAPCGSPPGRRRRGWRPRGGGRRRRTRKQHLRSSVGGKHFHNQRKERFPFHTLYVLFLCTEQRGEGGGPRCVGEEGKDSFKTRPLTMWHTMNVEV